MRSSEYRDGYNAYLDGLTAQDNPYSSDEGEWEEWLDGYYDAGFDD